MVDNHQDVGARLVCGQGFPNFYARDVMEAKSGKSGIPPCASNYVDWFWGPVYRSIGLCKSIKSYNYQLDKDGNPEIEECQKVMFANYYNSPESQALFEALYNNDLNLQDKFASYWNAVSQRLSQNQYVIGYDPINEPLPASFFKNPFLIHPFKFNREQLTPLYERMYKIYQQNNPSKDEKNIMYFEPGQFPDIIGNLGTKSIVNALGFKTPPGGKIGSDTHVLNEHTYCCQMGDTICEDGEPKEGMEDVCMEWHLKRMGQRSEDARKLGVPMLLTEFGACMESKTCGIEIGQVL